MFFPTEVSMNRLFKTTVVIGLLLSTRGIFAQESSDPAPRAIRVLAHRAEVEPDSGKAEFRGDVLLQEKTAADARPTAPGIVRIPRAQDWSRTVAVQPDGQGNIIYAASLAMRTEKGAFLGLNATRAPAVLREQLKLKAGLVVDAVEPNSPADVAGLKPLDVVEKLDDQWLINPAQLAGLVKMQKPGDVVTLTILHKGDRQALKVKLAEREMPVADDDAQPALPGWPGLPSGTWHYNVDAAGAPPDATVWKDSGANDPGMMVRAVKLMRAEVVPQDGDAAYEDKSITLRLNRNDGHTVLTATDKAGKKLVEGPIDAPQDREKLPQEVRQRMDKLERLRADVELTERRREVEKALLERETAVRQLQKETETLRNEVEVRRREAEAAESRVRALQPDQK
jgi:hypothetical protein